MSFWAFVTQSVACVWVMWSARLGSFGFWGWGCGRQKWAIVGLRSIMRVYAILGKRD